MTARPAWYTIQRGGGLADFINLLHTPYTVWHLSYVLIGIALAPTVYVGRSVAVLIAFFLGLGVGAHALDETMGNPLQTKLSKSNLYLLGFGTLAAAVVIGLYYVATLSLLLLPFIGIESFFAVAYNLEIFKARLHTTLVFALSWGSIPFLTGYFVNALSISIPAVIIAIAIGFLTVVQKTLSTQARLVRRKAALSVNALRLESGVLVPVSSEEIINASEKSLKFLSVVIFLLGIALVLERILAGPL